MDDSDLQLEEVYLQPGELYIARKPTIIRTLLGSCVGIAFWCRRLGGVGALCHAMLPKCPKSITSGKRGHVEFKYVDFSIRHIARELEKMGAGRSEVEVKIFGGADVLLSGTDVHSRRTVGRLNCDSAIEVLEAEGFRVSASSVRGVSGVNIYFNTSNGEVLLRRLPNIPEIPAAQKD